jgi:N-acetyl-anhydromuramyl-L-alanine amidase AmpD
MSFGLFNDTLSQAQTLKNNESVEFIKLNLNDIIQVEFPNDQYFREQTDKKQIVLHHTVSGQGVEGDIAWWRQTVERIGTAIIVGWDGEIYQCFSTKYWAHHLGTHAANNTALNKASIGIEIDAWGALMESGGKWYPVKWDDVTKKNIPNTAIKAIQNVELYPAGFKGFYGFEKYTNAQIDAVKKLLIFWNERYGIPLDYNEDMWAISNVALSGKAGVWTHVSFREDKSDCHPQKELIDMLKSLK